MEKKCSSICIVSFPISISFAIPLSNLIRILSSLYDDIDIIVGAYKDMPLAEDDRVRYHEYIHKNSDSIIVKVIRYIWLQMVMTLMVLQRSRKSDIIIFFMELGPFLPLAIARLLGKKTIWMLPSSFLKMSEKGGQYPRLLKWLHPLNYLMAGRIVVYSDRIVEEWGLKRYKHKIIVGSEHYIDTGSFSIAKPVVDRDKVIGYVGRLSEEKGILNFIEALPGIADHWPEYRFIIIGDGPLRNEVRDLINKYRLADKIDCTGWVSRDRLPAYLNNIKLLIVPSYTEGLPNTIIEAMSCGTIVIATPVGAIPDIISNGNNGFIMKNNSVVEISSAIDLALSTADINQMSIKSRELIVKYYNFNSTVERFRTILETRGESDAPDF